MAKKIIRIDGVVKKIKDDKEYSITHAVLETGEEVSGWGSDFKVGDVVEYWFDSQFNKTKMRKKR